MDRIRDSRQQLAAATIETEQRKAIHDLTTALGEYFDSDMQFRTDELKKIRDGLVNMQARFEKRTLAKDSIVELQLKMIVNEANGLGFFSGDDEGDRSAQSRYTLFEYPSVPPTPGKRGQ